MSYTLLIVDIQPEFRSAVTKKVKEICKNEIQRAIDTNAGIIFLEYNDSGRTMSGLTRITKGYKKVHIIQKEDNDGSSEVRKAVTRFKLPKRKFRVCGVNTDACVEETVIGLSYSAVRGSNIEVVASGCWSIGGHRGHLDGLRQMSKQSYVKVV